MPRKKGIKSKKPRTSPIHEEPPTTNGIITDVRHFPTPFRPDLPPFDKENIELSFNRFVLAALDKPTITKLSHRQGESQTPYLDIKSCLTRLYTKRENAEMDKLLKRMRMGLSKPSLYFNALQANYGSSSEFVLTGMFVESLPSKIRSELPLRYKNLKNLVAVADQIFDNMTGASGSQSLVVQPHNVNQRFERKTVNF